MNGMIDELSDVVDVVIIGAGPTGLALGLEVKARGLSHVIIDKGTVVNTIVGYPTAMTFFSTPELLELGAMPFTTPNVRPTRAEAIEYYRGVVRRGELRLSLNNRVHGVEGSKGAFVVDSTRGPVKGRRVVLATGYFDTPNPLDVPGADLPKVHHYYHEAYYAFGCDVIVIGGRNSAVETALDLWRHGARVTLVHRGDELSKSVKYWIRPDIENRMRRGEIRALMSTRVEMIDERAVVVRNTRTGESTTLKNDLVYAMIGYRPDTALLSAFGIAFDPETLVPEHDPSTFETNVPGIYIAGSVGCGCKTWEIFIENGRHHASIVASAIADDKVAE